MTVHRPPRVVHVSTAHPATDTRIFHKECRTLAAAGFDVTLVVRTNHPAVIDGVRLQPAPRVPGRVRRALLGPLRTYPTLRHLDADLYHLHDPELLPVGLVLRFRGRRVIYDAHEHLGDDLRGKPYLPATVARILAPLASALERRIARRLTHVVAATPTIAAQFDPARTTVIHNYPDLDELGDPSLDGPPYAQRPPVGCYVGGLTAERCVGTMVDAARLVRRSHPDFSLLLAGPVRGVEIPDDPAVRYLGVLDRRSVAGLLGSSRFGVVLLAATPNCAEGMPTKFFEYLAAGLPVVVSRSTRPIATVTEQEGCGLVVDADDPEDVARAMCLLLDDPQGASRMGEAGRAAIAHTRTWANEGAALVRLYQRLFAAAPT